MGENNNHLDSKKPQVITKSSKFSFFKVEEQLN
jgi:hypothetical protein